MRRLRALGALALLMVLTPGSAHATTGSFDVTITSIVPAVASGNDSIVMDVTLTNRTTNDVTDLGAKFLIATTPLRGRSEIADIVSNKAMPTYRYSGDDLASGIDLVPGASMTITMRTTTRALGLSDARPGVYAIGAFVHGVAGNGKVERRAVTLLPWMTGAQASIGVTTVVTLTAPPSRGIDGVFLDDSLAKSLATGGRLRQQVTVMSRVPGVLWLVDPLLVESVKVLAAGARITGPDGVRSTTDGEVKAASQWLADARSAIATGTLAAIPVGDLDIRAALAHGQVTLLRHASATASQRVAAALELPAPPLVAPIDGGALSNASWQVLTSLGFSTALVSDAAYAPTQQMYTPSTSVNVSAFAGRVLVVDRAASNALSGATTARQAFASHLLMAALERPSSKRIITVALPAQWTPIDGTDEVLTSSWIRLTTPDAAGVDTAPRRIVQLRVTPQESRQVRELRRLLPQMRLLTNLGSDEAFSSTLSDAVGGVLSRWWTRRIPDSAYASLTKTHLDTLRNSVRVVTRGDIVFGGQRGNVPVTVANGLPVPIDITLQATGLPSVRVAPRAQTTMHINAGKRVSVEVPTRVTGSGDAYLLLQLITAGGSEVGTQVLLTVRSAAYARVASYVVAIAFVALLLLVAVNTVRRVRLRRLGVDEDE